MASARTCQCHQVVVALGEVESGLILLGGLGGGCHQCAILSMKGIQRNGAAGIGGRAREDAYAMRRLCGICPLIDDGRHAPHEKAEHKQMEHPLHGLFLCLYCDALDEA